ncbi:MULTISPECIES: J domain-containing protein [Haloferax]|uniref:DnaJ domain-containing protein n=2 Tax=Haloferax TaxID=2251 RepID=A0A6G1Z236_9EURY|nr:MULTISPECIES: J domain-containing protein [Haloferax]KAB1187927.1 DnaJ domain-containing protein [Haloferax sp. CBA1149]MRW80592.1 DnaJ domain-containing protein [Haloferax marinisediminis]
MDRDRLVMGLAAVFAGITMLIVVLAFVYQPFLLVMAIPFGATTYFMYSHVSGRLEERFRRTRVRAGAGGVGFQSERRRASRQTTGGFGAGPRGDPRQGPGAGRFRDVGGRTGYQNRSQRVRPPRNPVSRQEALRTLGLDDGASPEEVKQAYRERVKETHPDSKNGDQEAFKRVSRAYERLSE